MKPTQLEKQVILGAAVMALVLGIYLFASSFRAKDNLYDHRAIKISAINREYKPAPVFNNAPSRALNASFLPQAYRATHGTYSVTITTTLSLANLNSAGSCYLEISPNNSTWTTIQSAGVTQALSVSLSLGLTTTTTYNLTGWVPLNYYCRIRTVTSGGATATLANGQEVAF